MRQATWFSARTPARPAGSQPSRPAPQRGAAWPLWSAGCAVVLAGPAAAAVDFGAVFSLKGQSVYAPGDAVLLDINRRLGPPAFDIGKQYGGMFNACSPVANCPSGAEAGANTNGSFGLNYGAKFDGGSYDLLYPVLARIAEPAAYSNTVGSAFTLGTSFKIPGYGAPAYQEILNGQRMVAKLTTHSPTLQAYVDLDARLHAFVGARGCVLGVCTGPALGPLDGDASRTLASINRNNDGRIVLGNETVDLRRTVTLLDGNLSAWLNIPNIDAVSSPANSTATQLRSLGRDGIVSLGVNVGNLVSKAVGVPLVGNAAGIGYNLLGINAGLGLDVAQTIRIDLQPKMTFDFLSPVQLQLADGAWGAPTKQLSVPLGQSLVLKSNVRNVGVLPSTSLAVTVSNRTELILQGDVNVQALAANVFGLDIGPLYDSGPLNAGALSIPLFENSFSFAMGAITGLPFNVQQALPDNVLAEPGYRALFAAGPQDAQGLQSGDILSLNLDCPLVLSCNPVRVASTNLSLVNQFGERAFLVDADTLQLAGNQAVAPGTDASQLALLLATGYQTERLALVSPIGLPSPVPEPAGWALLLLGLAATALVARPGRPAVLLHSQGRGA